LDDYPPAQFIGHEGCFVNVDFKKGLTDEDVDKAIGILNEAPTVFTVPCNKPFVVTREKAEEMGLLKPQRCLTPEERAEIKRRADRWRIPDKKGDFRMNIAYKFKCTGCSHTWETYTTDRCLYPIENTVFRTEAIDEKLITCSNYGMVSSATSCGRAKFACLTALSGKRVKINMSVVYLNIPPLFIFTKGQIYYE
jgi:hypothetical protein